MFDFLKYPKYKVEELSNGKFIAYRKASRRARWAALDRNEPGRFYWSIIVPIRSYCICDDEEEAANVIAAAIKYVAPPPVLSLEEQIKKHLK